MGTPCMRCVPHTGDTSLMGTARVKYKKEPDARIIVIWNMKER